VGQREGRGRQSKANMREERQPPAPHRWLKGRGRGHYHLHVCAGAQQQFVWVLGFKESGNLAGKLQQTRKQKMIRNVNS